MADLPLVMLLVISIIELMEEKKMKLGDKVRDKVTGLVGITVDRIEYLNGCIQYGVQPPYKKGSTELPTWRIDEEQLEVVPKKQVSVRKSKTGGPTRKV